MVSLWGYLVPTAKLVQPAMLRCNRSSVARTHVLARVPREGGLLLPRDNKFILNPPAFRCQFSYRIAWLHLIRNTFYPEPEQEMHAAAGEVKSTG